MAEEAVLTIIFRDEASTGGAGQTGSAPSQGGSTLSDRPSENIKEVIREIQAESKASSIHVEPTKAIGAEALKAEKAEVSPESALESIKSIQGYKHLQQIESLELAAEVAAKEVGRQHAAAQQVLPQIIIEAERAAQAAQVQPPQIEPLSVKVEQPKPPEVQPLQTAQTQAEQIRTDAITAQQISQQQSVITAQQLVSEAAKPSASDVKPPEQPPLSPPQAATPQAPTGQPLAPPPAASPVSPPVEPAGQGQPPVAPIGPPGGMPPMPPGPPQPPGPPGQPGPPQPPEPSDSSKQTQENVAEARGAIGKLLQTTGQFLLSEEAQTAITRAATLGVTPAVTGALTTAGVSLGIATAAGAAAAAPAAVWKVAESIRTAETSAALVFSPEAVAADAEARIRRITTDIEIAQRLGDEIAANLQASSRLSTAARRFGSVVGEPVIRDIGRVKSGAASALEMITAAITPSSETTRLIGNILSRTAIYTASFGAAGAGIGAGIGLMVGGPPGAAAGAGIGGKIGVGIGLGASISMGAADIYNYMRKDQTDSLKDKVESAEKVGRETANLLHNLIPELPNVDDYVKDFMIEWTSTRSGVIRGTGASWSFD